MSKDRGVALVLVLAITGVLSLLILQIGLTVRQQVGQAQQLTDRVEAELRLHSRESALLYSLLTRPKTTAPQSIVSGKSDVDNPYATGWNFRGEAFTVDEAEIRLQDLNGLYPMTRAGANPREFVSLLMAIGVDPVRADRVSKDLQSMLSTQRGVPLQAIGEIAAISDLNPDEVDRLADVATLYPVGPLNPGTAREQVLAARYVGSKLAGLLSARQAGALDEGRWTAITGDFSDDMTTTFQVGPGFRLEILVAFRGVRLRRESVWTIRSASPGTPLELWSYRNLDPRGSGSPDDNE